MAEPTEVLDTIDLLYRAAVDPTLWRQALHQLAHVCGGIGTAMIPITPQDITGLILSPELDESSIEYRREWWRHDTRVLRIFSRKLSDGVCCEAELFTDAELARDPLRHEFLGAYGIGAFAAQLVAPLPDLVVAFSVQRALKRGHFEKQNLETLKLLGAHAARALVVSMRLSAVSKLEQTAAGALERLDCAVLVVDRDLNVLVLNAAAEQLIGDGIAIQQARLQASSHEHHDRLVRFVTSIVQRKEAVAGDPAPLMLPRPSGRRPLLVQAVPLAPESLEWNVHGSPAALLIIADPDRTNDYSAVRELRSLGLTRAEARLGALVGAGRSRGEAAEQLGISPSTASDTLKRIYSKLDISRQAELVRLVDRLAVLKPHRGDSRSPS